MSITFIERSTPRARQVIQSHEKWGHSDPLHIYDPEEYWVNLTHGFGIHDDTLDCSMLWFKGDPVIAETQLSAQYQRTINTFLGIPSPEGLPYSRQVGVDSVPYLRSNHRTCFVGYLVHIYLLSESFEVVMLYDQRDLEVAKVICRYLQRIQHDICF